MCLCVRKGRETERERETEKERERERQRESVCVHMCVCACRREDPSKGAGVHVGKRTCLQFRMFWIGYYTSAGRDLEARHPDRQV